jgi:peptidoglycan/LPS O-acetylase OafA/YrhL
VLPATRFETGSPLLRGSILVAYLAVIAAAAVATFHLIEEPARKWLRTRSAKNEPIPSTKYVVDTLAEPVTEPINEPVNA